MDKLLRYKKVVLNIRNRHLHAILSRTTMAKTFDGPPTLELSGSEHRVGRLHP